MTKPKCGKGQSCGNSCISAKDTCKEKLDATTAFKLIAVTQQLSSIRDKAIKSFAPSDTGKTFEELEAKYQFLTSARGTSIEEKLDKGISLWHITMPASDASGDTLSYSVLNAGGKSYTVSDGLIKEYTASDRNGLYKESIQAAIRAKVEQDLLPKQTDLKSEAAKALRTGDTFSGGYRVINYATSSGVSFAMYVKRESDEPYAPLASWALNMEGKLVKHNSDAEAREAGLKAVLAGKTLADGETGDSTSSPAATVKVTPAPKPEPAVSVPSSKQDTSKSADFDSSKLGSKEADSSGSSLSEDRQLKLQTKIKSALDKASLIVNVPDLASILDDGKLKNIFETNPEIDNTARARQESDKFGVSLATRAENRPIYGSLLTPGQKNSAGMYGEVEITLNDKLKERTTVVAGDSLSSSNASTGSKADEPKLKSFKGSDDLADKEDITTKDLNKTYVEAQIHGGVKVSDIKSVKFPEDDENAEYYKEELDKLGIKYSTY